MKSCLSTSAMRRTAVGLQDPVSDAGYREFAITRTIPRIVDHCLSTRCLAAAPRDNRLFGLECGVIGGARRRSVAF